MALKRWIAQLVVGHRASSLIRRCQFKTQVALKASRNARNYIHFLGVNVGLNALT